MQQKNKKKNEKAVAESVQQPLLYYETNLVSTINILKCLNETNCRTLIFSSSATVYGDPSSVPINEAPQKGAHEITNPYGKTKHFVEHILMDFGNVFLFFFFFVFVCVLGLRNRVTSRKFATNNKITDTH